MATAFILMAFTLLTWSLIKNRKRPTVCPSVFVLRDRLPELARWIMSSFFITLSVVPPISLKFIGAFLAALITTLVFVNLAMRVLWRMTDDLST